MSASEQVKRFQAAREAAAANGSPASAANVSFVTADEQVARYVAGKKGGAAAAGDGDSDWVMVSLADCAPAAVSPALGSGSGDLTPRGYLAGFARNVLNKPAPAEVPSMFGVLTSLAQGTAHLGSGAAQQAMVSEWCIFAEAFAAADPTTQHRLLETLNAHLQPRFLVAGDELTIADVMVWAAVGPCLRGLEIDPRHKVPSVLRWFDHVQRLPGMETPYLMGVCLNQLGGGSH